MNRPGLCSLFGIPALALSLVAFVVSEIPVGEGGGTRAVVQFGFGMFFWLLSITLPAAWGLGALIGSSRKG